MTKRCRHCKRELPLEKFSKDKSSPDGLAPHCKECAHEWYVKRRQSGKVKVSPKRAEIDKARNDKGREFLFSLKTPCAKCGEARPYVIQFHHIDPSTKVGGIGMMKKYPKEVLIAEVKKCVCLCANCHFEYHFTYGNKPKDPVGTLEEYLNVKFTKEL
jgi:hypothetical protein